MTTGSSYAATTPKDAYVFVSERGGSYWFPPTHPARRRGRQDGISDAPTHCGQILRPGLVGRTMDDGAVAKSVGGNDDRPGDLELLLQRLGHATSRAINACAARQGIERD